MKNIIFLALVSTFLLASCNLSKSEEIKVADDIMIDGEHEGEWTEEEMKMMGTQHEDDTIMKDDTAEQEEEIILEKEVKIEQEDSVVIEKIEENPRELAGVYAEYDENLLGTTENTVLFFHATWCPSCRASDTAISGEKVPEGLTILKTDFDTETDLRKKYGVVTQHTFVQIDSDGNEIKKWVGGTSAQDILDRIQ